MWKGITFIDWHGMAHTITRVQHNTCRTNKVYPVEMDKALYCKMFFDGKEGG
jgi:hypothetical protein